MIEHNWFRDHSILEVRPRGSLQPNDFAILAKQVDPVIIEHGRLEGLLIDAVDFSGWESFAALVTHCQFVRNHHRHIHKIAIVSDHSLLAFMPQLVDHFVCAEVRPFAVADRGRALDWLAEAG
ncbi:SpoIIAA family protein [Microbulbifer hainanensis]|uniref:STAS/SEC14 domain-containing protein n=1 Tax=Microbulbifer hainanensis TaxID=2735675 RepID=UPI001865C372|nr:STAS/SEC14 domain-containing protein [Microbulbifer hainanensis]